MWPQYRPPTTSLICLLNAFKNLYHQFFIYFIIIITTITSSIHKLKVNRETGVMPRYRWYNNPGGENSFWKNLNSSNSMMVIIFYDSFECHLIFLSPLLLVVD